MKTWKTKQLKNLAEILCTIEKPKDMLAFLRDLCTLEELEEISDRWHIVELLSQGYSYRKIATKLGVSTTTVARVASWLSNGQGGYTKALENKTSLHK